MLDALVMNKKIISRVRKLRNKALKKMGKPDSYPFLPELIEYLNLFEEIIIKGKAHPRHSKNERAKLAGGMERIITESYDFSESELGNEFLEIAEEFTK